MVFLETLKNIQFLQDFSDDHLQNIASLAEIKEFPAGSVVFREGQPTSSVYLVVQGNITLEINVPARGAMQSQTVGSGELLDWTPVQRFPEEPKHLQDKDLCVHYFAKKSPSWYAPSIRP